jgi:Zn-dependent alcohol dehydrogenases
MAAPEIPAKQKAVVYDQPGTVSTKVVELDVPEPGTGEVLINLYALFLAISILELH